MDVIHDICIANLEPHLEPYSCWDELHCDLDIHDILKMSKNKISTLPEKPSLDDQHKLYWFHVHKVAYFMNNNIKDPIDIDVGMPEFGYTPFYMIADGNHRLLASIIKKRKKYQGNS